MIQEVAMHKCVCDNCGKDIEFGEGWTTFLPENIQDWIDNSPESVEVIDGKHICADCIIIDDNDNKIIKPCQPK